MSKILFVTTISNTVNAFLIPHMKCLVDQGHQVDIACSIIQEVKDDIINLGCEVNNIEFQRSPLSTKNYIAYRKIKKLIYQKKYDLVHTHTPVASFITRLACRNNSNVKVLYTAHGFHFFKGAPMKNWLIYHTMEKLAAKWTDAIVTINDEDTQAAKGLRMDLTVHKVNGVGIDLNRFIPQTEGDKGLLRNQYGFADEDFILLYTAELNHNKHQDLLINAISLLRNRVPSIRLLLAGSGTLEKQYKMQVEKLDLMSHVNFLGYRSDISELLRIADVAVSSSRREGLPVNIMEAMATGLPIVVTDSRGNRDLVRDGYNGYVVGVDDTEAYAQAIERLYLSKDLRVKFAESNLVLIKLFSLEQVTKDLEDMYRLYQ